MGAHINFGFPPDGIRYNQLYNSGSLLYNLITGSSGESSATGQALLDKINSLSGFVTGLSGHFNDRIIATGNSAVAHANGVGTNLSGNLAQTGAILLAADLSLSGALTGRIHQSGLDLYNQLYNTGQLLFNRDAAISGGLEVRISATGNSAVAHANGVGTNLSGNLAQTGAILLAADLSLSGALTGRIHQSGLDLYNQLYNTGQLLFNRDAAISGGLEVRISATGNSAVAHANGVGINLSGNLQQTGSNLQNQINLLSQGTGNILQNVVFTSGTQFISGTKYFIGNTFIDNLFVTGTQTVIHSQDFYVSDNWIVLNATGGARDSALFVSTGITGFNATGGVIGFDVPSNTWRFGMGSQQTDLIFLPRIASGEAVDLVDAKVNSLSGFVIGASGGLETRIIQSGNSSIAHANGIGINLSGNLAQTGATLIQRDLDISGALQAQITEANADVSSINRQSGALLITGTGGITVLSGSPTLIIISGDQSISGYVDLISGGLEVRITTTGNAAVAHANSIGQTISGNLTITGQTLNTRVDLISGQLTSLSGWTNNVVSGGLDFRLTQTGSTLWQRDLSISGALSAVRVTGSNVISNVDLTGLGGTLVFWSGNQVFISGGAGGGGGSDVRVTGSGPISSPNFTGVNGIQVFTSGSTVFVSGISFSGRKSLQLYTYGIPSGSSGLFVPFNAAFNTIPIVITELNSITQDLFVKSLNGISLTGFNILLSSPVTGSGIASLNIFASESGNLLFDSNYTPFNNITPSITVTGNYVIGATDYRIYCENVVPITLTFPTNFSGQSLAIKLLQTGSVTFTGTSSSFDGQPSYVAIGQYNAYHLHSRNNNVWNLW